MKKLDMDWLLPKKRMEYRSCNKVNGLISCQVNKYFKVIRNSRRTSFCIRRQYCRQVNEKNEDVLNKVIAIADRLRGRSISKENQARPGGGAAEAAEPRTAASTFCRIPRAMLC